MSTYTAGDPFIVNTTTAGNQGPNYHGHNVTGLPGGGFVNVWQGRGASGTDADIFMQRYDNLGNKVGVETVVNTTTADNQYMPQVNYLTGGGFVVVWTSYGQDGGGGSNGGGGVYFQQYDASGNKVGGETRANTTVANEQDTPSIIGTPDGGFLIVWDSFNQDGDRYGEYGQLFNSTGAKVGGEMHLSTSSAGTQDSSSLALYQGGLVIAYNKASAFDTDGNATNYDVVMQRYDGTGAAVGTETVVNTTTAGNQYFSSITTMADGGFLVTWVNNAGANSLINAQRYDKTGAKVGGEVQVNTTSTGDAESTGVTLLKDGGYVVTWSMMTADGTYDVFLQQFDISGNKTGGQVLVNNTFTTGDQIFPSVAVLSDGSFVVSYRSPDSDVNGIYQRVFYLDQTINDTTGGHTITGGYGSDTINGLDGNDTLDGGGGPGNDTLNGGDGNDTLVLQGGDTGNGGNGDDVLKITHLNGRPIFFDAGAGYDIVDATTVDFGAVWQFTNGQNVEEYRAGSHGDTVDAHLVTNIPVFTFKGGAGNDVVYAGSGADILTGAGGNDYLDGGSGADKMSGGAGNDTYVVDSASDTVDETVGGGNTADAGGNDTVRSYITYTLGDNVENLILLGTGNINGTGNGLANMLTGNSGANTLSGGAGNDTYVVDNAGDVVRETLANGTTDAGGTDEVQSSITYVLGAFVENLTLTGTGNINGTGNGLANVLKGNDGNNILLGGKGNDTLIGNAGNDNLDGGEGADTLIGGIGDDTYSVENAGDIVTEKAGEGTDTVKTNLAAYTLAANLENLILTGSANSNGTGNDANNSIIGNGANNILLGGKGNDTLDGGAGDDYLDGGSGSDKLVGGAGNDTYVYGVGDTIVEAANAGIDTVLSSVASMTLGATLENITLVSAAVSADGNNLDNLMIGNALANTLRGGGGNDTISGGDGNDTLSGGKGNDWLDGGKGNDTMSGGQGNDTYVVDSTLDIVDETVGNGNTGDVGGHELVMASISYVLGNYIEDLTLTGTANINATGNGLANIITGNDGNNVLLGGKGNDTLIAGGGNDVVDGGEGADIMTGGAGNDTYSVENAGDVVNEKAGEGTDTVKTNLNGYILAANVENLILTGSGNIGGNGNDLANSLTGNGGGNALRGGAGNDSLTGGAGSDTFVFEHFGTANGQDTITDFASGTDHLAFKASDYGFTAGHVLSGAELSTTGLASGSNAQFIYNPVTHTLSWDPDGVGATLATVIVTFSNNAQPGTADFIFT